MQPFQAVAFEPKSRPNIELLTRSFDKIENRVNEYHKNLSAMDTAFAQIQSSLSQDKDTLQWFENFKNKYKDEVTQFAKLGDYANAGRFGQRLAAEMLNDGELIGNIHAYETYKAEYDKAKQKAEASGDVIGLNYFEEQNKYNPNNISWLLDDNGKITGADRYDITRPYFETIDYAKEIWAKGFQLINPDQSSKSTSSQHSTSYSDDYGGTNTSSGASHSTSVSKVTAEEILKSWDKVVKGLGITPSRIKYDFDARCAWMDKLQREYDSLSQMDKLSSKGQDMLYEIELYKSVLVHNGIRDYKSYYADMVAGGDTAKAVAELMAYKHTNVSDSVQSSSGRDVRDPKGMAELTARANAEANGTYVGTPTDTAINGDQKAGNPIRLLSNITNHVHSQFNKVAKTLTGN